MPLATTRAAVEQTTRAYAHRQEATGYLSLGVTPRSPLSLVGV